MTMLNRAITGYGLTMVAIGSCIGSGIFLTPSQIAGHLPSPLLILLVWAVDRHFFIAYTLIEKPRQAWAGLIFMVIGIGVFYFFKKQKGG